jgi:glycosyltransferase involved in cell wall biosynthesis
MRIYQEIFAIPDTERTWFKSAISKCREISKDNKFDAIISSSPFPTVHRVASHIKKELDIPWIADFRDLWSQNHNYSFSKLRLIIDRWLEMRTLLKCNLITTVSKSLRDKLLNLHNKQVIIIRNGYQSLDYTPLIKLPDRFTITYTGTIYDKKQDPEKIIKALKNLIDSGSIDAGKISINFYGKHSSLLETIIKKYKVEKVVKQLGFINRIASRKKQLESHVLLFFQWEDLKETDLCPLKFYEYLSAGKTIFATGGSRFTEVVDIIKRTNTGFIAVELIDVQKILKKLYDQFIKKKIIYLANKKVISNYSFFQSSKQFKELLDKLITNEKSI